jgi:SHS family lactate transporter-like MFS transporter
MATLNATSHGTQDLYATFLQKQHGFSTATTSLLSVLAGVGAIAGSITFGTLSQRIGRRTSVIISATLGLFTIPLWALSPTAGLLASGAFVMQFFVQGVWGVIPAHLNEVSPPEVRGTFPGFTYQLGNLLAAGIVQIEAVIAKRLPPLPTGTVNYGAAMAIVTAFVLVSVVTLAAIGYLVRKENRFVRLSAVQEVS